MRGQAGFFDIEERLKELSAKGDTLERLNGLVDFELFRPDLERAVPRADRSRGGRPPFDHVLMFRVLILQASHSLSDERAEFLIKDRLSKRLQFLFWRRAKIAEVCRIMRGTLQRRSLPDRSLRVQPAALATAQELRSYCDTVHGPGQRATASGHAQAV